jgi:hypothetical protein
VQNFSRGRLVAGCAIGVACGLTLPLLLTASVWVMPVAVIFAFLWVWAGWPTVAVGALSVALAGYKFLGWGFSLAFVYLALPGVLAAILTGFRKPFFRAVTLSVAAQWFAYISLTVAMWLIFRQNLVDVLTGALEDMFRGLPAYLQHYLVLQMGQMGLFGSNTGINFSNAILTDAQLQSLISQLIYTINEGLKLSLPAYVLTSGATTGALSYGLAAWVRVRRGDDPAVPFVKPEGWRLSANLIIGPPALALVCLLLGQVGVLGAQEAYIAMISLARLLFSVQAVGVIDRRTKAAGMAPGKRAALIILALVFAQGLMPFVGIYSALFGSQGLISAILRKKMNGKGDE